MHDIEITVIVFQSEINIVDFTPVKIGLIGTSIVGLSCILTYNWVAFR
jgi:hypothetical protein